MHQAAAHGANPDIRAAAKEELSGHALGVMLRANPRVTAGGLEQAQSGITVSGNPKPPFTT